MRTSERSAVRGLLPGLLVCLIGALCTIGARPAAAAPSEPLLFLGVVRGPAIDKLATQVVTEHLTDRQETLVSAAAISEADRRCRRAQCLGTLASGRKAELVLSGDVSEITGTKNTLRVLMHLYDARRREVLDQENLCADCDETKLGILLTSTTSELLLRYRKAASASAQVNSLLDTLEKEKQAAQGPTSGQAGAPGAGPTPTTPLPPVGSERGPSAPPGVLPMAPPGVLPLPSQATLPLPPTAPPLPVAPGGQNGQAAQAGDRPVAYPTPLPPPPVFPAPAQPAADERPAQAPRRGLSPKRKAIAGVFGALGAGTLVASIVLTALDQRLDPKLSYNPSGSACSDPANAGRNCVLSMVRLWGPGYGLSALLLGGMVLTLALPEGGSR
jgi:hypothetical protein